MSIPLPGRGTATPPNDDALLPGHGLETVVRESKVERLVIRPHDVRGMRWLEKALKSIDASRGD